MENTYHSTYNDYLIHKTTQKKPLRNAILDPNFNLKQNLPLYINYQMKELHKIKEKKNKEVDYNSIHENIVQKIEKINELSSVNEKTQNFKTYENYLPSAKNKKPKVNINSFQSNMVKSLYNKIYKKNEFSNKAIDKYFTFESPESILLHRKNDNKSKPSLENNLKVLLSETMEDGYIGNLFKKFSALQLKKNIISEKKYTNLKEDPKSLDFESRYDSLFKKSHKNEKEYQQSLKDFCKTHKISMTKLLHLPQSNYFAYFKLIVKSYNQ